MAFYGIFISNITPVTIKRKNTTYSNMRKITEEALKNIEQRETLIVASIKTLKYQKMK